MALDCSLREVNPQCYLVVDRPLEARSSISSSLARARPQIPHPLLLRIPKGMPITTFSLFGSTMAARTAATRCAAEALLRM